MLDNDCLSKNDVDDDYGNCIAGGISYMKGNFLEKKYDNVSNQVYNIGKKVTYFSVIFKKSGKKLSFHQKI